MRSSEIRASFLKFFEERGHAVVPSSSLVPAGDPTLFFSNAGMNQFKDVFTGQATRPYVRAASCQKCLRVSGKHNDFETVGRSLKHHTFFEMLGNFSFGDYFKREAITWAWQLVTEHWKLPADRLVVSVFEDDDEAEGIWRKDVGLSAERVYRLGAAENYWAMGDTGPNGPCSEIHLDHGPAIGCRRPECSPACSCDRYIELWNLVFMQFDRAADGTQTRLPKPSIDTGMGLERVSTVLQDVVSTYDTDAFRPIVDFVSQRSGVACPRVMRGAEDASSQDERQVSVRVVADHVRAITFLLADGVAPSNEGRGYVLRKLLRRAAGHAGRIGLPAPILSEACHVVVENMAGAYPELARQEERIRAACAREEAAFEATLRQGGAEFEYLLATLATKGSEEIPGADAFRLHDTFGFPLEYTIETARVRGFTVDRAGFDAALEAQRERARAGAKTGAAAPHLPPHLSVDETEFLGYVETETSGCTVLALLRDGQPVPELAAGAEGWVVLDRTPFYAESGGQVGDTGVLAAVGARAAVHDTQSLRPSVTGHRVTVESGVLRRGEAVEAAVDAPRRRRIMANHTATHLLHRALKDTLGEDVRQAGSLVAPDRLRFDFTWHEPLSPEQLARVEEKVNERVFAHVQVDKREMSHAEAMTRGAVAMFGEKYGERVRVVAVDEWSVELCGGTHCDRTEQVGAFKIVSERGIASGVRRIEAVTGPGVQERLHEDERLIEELEAALKAPREELSAAVRRLAEQVKTLRREADLARKGLAESGGAAAATERRDVGGFSVEWKLLPGMDVAQLREIAVGAREKAGVDALALGSERDGKAGLVVTLGPRLVTRLGGDSPAGSLARDLARVVGGGGAGRADLGWAGGKQVDQLGPALSQLPTLLAARLDA